MAYSVGLALYNMAARRTTRAPLSRAERPIGPLVWLHAPSGESLPGMAELGRRLIEDDGISVLLTTPESAPLPGLILQKAPADSSADVQEFLKYWRPDLIITAEGELRPALLHEAAERKVPALMVEARAPHLMPDREGWYPGLIRAALAQIRMIHPVDTAAARAFRKAGAEAKALKVVGRLERASVLLPYLEAERASLAGLLAARPVWLAMAVPAVEEDLILAAHRAALAKSHRLLLILVPQDPARAAALAARIEQDEGWRVALRSAEQEPEPEVEVFLPDQPGESGLWYRLAPVTYLGGSLLGDGCAVNPLEPATTGSAILFGPRTGGFDAAYASLGPALAAHMVANGDDLSAGLSDLLSPDRAARQAHAAWEVISEGADVTEALLTTLRSLLKGAT
jgi:3-deoxy-D-manno-octulosonic-acid transferase